MALAKVQYSVKGKMVPKKEFRRLVKDQSEDYVEMIIGLCKSLNPDNPKPWILTIIDSGGFHFAPALETKQ